jgi:hypothetical protein
MGRCAEGQKGRRVERRKGGKVDWENVERVCITYIEGLHPSFQDDTLSGLSKNEALKGHPPKSVAARPSNDTPFCPSAFPPFRHGFALYIMTTLYLRSLSDVVNLFSYIFALYKIVIYLHY